MDLLETRDLVYFVAVAEELHFGRAARRAGIAQPALSRAIARLERRLGVVLLHRTSRHVELTAAGEVLLREGIRALDTVAGAASRTRRVGLRAPLVLAMKSGTDAGLLAPLIHRFGTDPHAVPVEITHSADERLRMLRDGRADLALLHHPNNDTTGLHTLALRTDPQIAVLAPTHPLATRSALTTTDLTDEHIVRWPESVPRPSTTRPLVRDTGHLTHLATTANAIALLPASASPLVPRGLTCVPLPDAPPITTVLAWLPNTESPALTAFLRHARETIAPNDQGPGSRRAQATTAAGRQHLAG